MKKVEAWRLELLHYMDYMDSISMVRRHEGVIVNFSCKKLLILSLAFHVIFGSDFVLFLLLVIFYNFIIQVFIIDIFHDLEIVDKGRFHKKMRKMNH